MNTVDGKYASAKVYTDNVEDYALAQIQMICDNATAAGSIIRVMPDVHPGKVGPIGLTMSVKNAVLPSLVGIDIGCGVSVMSLKAKRMEFQKLDTVIREQIPSGFGIRKKPHRFSEDFPFEELKCYRHINLNKAMCSMGTLGGGNHFIEVDQSEDKVLFVVIHSGSRSLGKSVAEYYMKAGQDALKEQGIRTDASNVTVNDVYDLWCNMKRGLRGNTFQNYKYMYNQFVAPDLGHYKVRTLKKSDLKRFYNKLVDERHLKIATVDSIHTVLHQVLTVAVEDGYLRNNVADNVLRELKTSCNLGNTHRKALTVPEQNLFIDYLRNEQNPYHHWYPIFAVMLGTGMRVGEVTALRWCDIDMEENLIDVNHTLVYYDHGRKECSYSIHKPKTEAGERTIPMLDCVKEAFLMERQYQEEVGLHCITTVEGYTDFVFLNRFGGVLNRAVLNKALRRIIRDCNDAQLSKGNAKVLLPRFSCHSLRHTYTTRLVEAGVNIKVVQDVLGHKDVETTLNIYTDVTKELKRKEFDSLQEKMNKSNENRNNDEGEV